MFVYISHEKFVVVSYLQGGSEKCFFSMNWQDIVAILFWSLFHFIFSLLPCIWATLCSVYFYKDFSVKVADLLTISSTAAWSKPSLCWHEHSPCQPLGKPNTQGQSLNFDKKSLNFIPEHYADICDKTNSGFRTTQRTSRASAGWLCRCCTPTNVGR